MALDIFSTHYLLASFKQVTPATTFLRDRYFPTNEATDIFSTEDVLIEYKDGNKKVAPFVSPRKGGITIHRDGSYMVRYTPPFIAPRRTLTIDELKVRGFGEALMSKLTPQQRESIMLLQDMEDLSQMITRREEVMAAEILTTNKCVMKHYADDLTTVVDEKEIRFFDGASNPASYTPTTKWGQTGAKIIDDIHAMVKMLTAKGLPASELLVSSDVASIIMSDENIQKLLDIRNYNLGSIAPMELPNGVTRLCVLNIYGRDITVLVYDETYENESGADTAYIPAGTVILTAPAVGRTMYGAITQLEQADGEFHTYAASRVPKYLSDAVGNTRSLTLSSAPLLIPNRRNSWITAKVTA